MKTLLTAPLLALAACVSPGPGLVPIEADGPVVRTVERVLQRVENYVTSEDCPLEVPAEVLGQIEAASEAARTMLAMPAASGDMLLVTMGNLMKLHDQLVLADLMRGGLEQLEADVYLEDTKRLRSLFDAVSIHQ
jgi:hypothetical protein